MLGCLLLSVVAALFALALIVNYAPPHISNIFLNPKKVVIGLQYQQEKEYRAEAEKREKTLNQILQDKRDLIFAKDAPFFGSSNPKAEVAIFFDYRCGYCRALAKTVSNVMKEDKYAQNVKFIIRDFPILSPLSKDLAVIGIKGFKANPGKFFEIHEYLFSAETKEAALARVKLLSAKDINLASSSEEDSMIRKNLDFGREIGIEGTPAMIIGDEFIGGLISEEQLKQKLDSALNGK
jgi:protein-disulfide isomerase